jgi:hypothetical protein
MYTVIVFLDTTVLLGDVEFRGAAWRVLAQAASAWDVRIFVPEVAITEATGGYLRRIVEAKAGLEGQANKHAGGLGEISKPAWEAADAALSEAASSYPARLRQHLTELKATIVDPPLVSHLILVERAARRQRPCNKNGDGYRDTLNWLSLIDLASQFPEEHIAWISDNKADFGTDDTLGLHSELKAELSTAHADDRVTWLRNLQELVVKLATEHSLKNSTDLGRLQGELHEQLLKEYINQQVLASAAGLAMDPRACALPTATTLAKGIPVGDARDLKLTVRAAALESDAVVEFRLEADTSILIELPPEVTSDDSTLATVSHGALSTAALSKPLWYTGLITLDRYGRPTGGELTRVAARDDDPGRTAWTVLDISVRKPREPFNPTFIKSIARLKPHQPTSSNIDAVNIANLLSHDSASTGWPAVAAAAMTFWYIWQMRDKEGKWQFNKPGTTRSVSPEGINGQTPRVSPESGKAEDSVDQGGADPDKDDNAQP